MYWLLSTGHRKRPVVRQAMKGAEDRLAHADATQSMCHYLQMLEPNCLAVVTCDVVFGFGLKHWKAYNNKSE